MNVDILKTCATCGQRYWWTAQQRQEYAAQGLAAPTQCSACCPVVYNEPPVDESCEIATTDQSSTAMAFPQLQQPLVTDDIRQLLNEAATPIVDRRRTVSEWFNGENVREKQLANKLWAGQAANSLVKQRIEFMDSVSEIARRADDFRRARLEAQLTAVELEDRIAERVALRHARLATLCAIEAEKQRKLLEPAPIPEPEHRRIIREHRQNLKAKATVRREALGDLEAEVKQIFNARMSGEQKVAQIRAVLEVYQQDESVLSKRVRAFLFFMEGEDDDDD